MPLIWKRVIDSQAEKLKELDKEIRPFRQSWEEADSMRSSVESLQNRVTELESVDKGAGQAARNTGEGGGAGEGQVWEGPGTGDCILDYSWDPMKVLLEPRGKWYIRHMLL